MTVTSFELLQQGPFQGGQSFGDSGPYERIDARLHYAVDPTHPSNTGIADLGLAPRDTEGLVHFSGDLCLLVPADAVRGNGGLLVELPNRGRRRLPRYLNRASIGVAGTVEIPAGDGFLFRHGYSVAWVGWQWDVPDSDALMGLDPPLAAGVRGGTILRFQPNTAHTTHLLADLTHRPYPTVDVDDPAAELWVSEYRNGPRQPIPRDAWRFASDLDGALSPDARYAHFPEGFQPGLVYDLLYTTAHAPVVGAGLLAVRDAGSFLRSTAPQNPLAGQLDRAIAFGISQTARMLRHFLWLGLNLDEQGRMVYDGILPNVGGARRGEFNQRFGQPSVQPAPSLGYLPPYDDAALLANQRAIGAAPKLVQTNSSAEYWRGDAAYLHLAADASSDLPADPDTRSYLFAGTQHDPSEVAPLQTPLDGSLGRYRYNWVDYTPLLRAAFVNLDRWVRDEVAPPPSVHPSLADGTLAPRDAVLEQFADGRVPDLHLPDREQLAYLWQVDPGPDAAHGVVRFPVDVTGRLPAFVSTIDADGNECGGLRLPDVTLPLATLAGWNPRDPGTGSTEQILDYKGATHPFPRTRADRTATDDPRRSIEERYPDLAGYLALVLGDAQRLIDQGYVLPEDLEVLLADAELRYREATR